MQNLISRPTLGLTQKERDRLSVHGLIRAVCEDNRDEIAAYRDVSNATAMLTGQPLATRGFYIPHDLLPATRAMTATGGGATGGYISGVENVGASTAINQNPLLSRLPITRLDGLTYDVTITAQSVQHGSVWVAEGAAATASEGTLGQISMTPKTCISFVTASRQLLRQGGALARRLIDNPLEVSNQEAIAAAIINGRDFSTGGSMAEPLGILQTGGIDSRAGAAFALADAVAMLTAAEGYSSDSSVAWVAGTAAAAILRQRAKVADTAEMLFTGGQMLDRPVVVSRAVPASKLICAAWSQVWLATWGAPELRIDESTYFNTGAVRVGVFSMVDVAVEKASQIAVATAVS